MIGIKVVTERAGGRTFTITGKESDISKDETGIHWRGDVRIIVNDGMTVRTDRATYASLTAWCGRPGGSSSRGAG